MRIDTTDNPGAAAVFDAIRRAGGFQSEDDVLRWLLYKGADQLDVVVAGDCLDLPYSRGHRRLLEKERHRA